MLDTFYISVSKAFDCALVVTTVLLVNLRSLTYKIDDFINIETLMCASMHNMYIVIFIELIWCSLKMREMSDLMIKKLPYFVFPSGKYYRMGNKMSP